METLKQFYKRTNEFTRSSLPAITEGFYTSQGLFQKVNESGKLLNFYGDTIVFLLDEESKEYAEKMRKILYQNCSEMFADPLLKATFHVTLHDLSNGISEEEIQTKICHNKNASEQILKKIKGDQEQEIQMKTTYVFNMVNTSVVLGLEPVDEENCTKLMEWYDMFQTVVNLSYPLTPHITLGYYRPGYYAPEVLKKLYDTFEILNKQKRKQICLKTESFVYQYFRNMNDFETYF